MTTDTKRFIEFSDIVGLRLHCKNPKCGTSLLINEGNIASLADQHNTTLTRCPLCESGWTVPNRNDNAYPGSNMAFDEGFKKFLRILLNMREFEKNLGCTVTFEIKVENKL
jgi:hypothetical protein